jgi:hypothetical protein
MSTLNINNDYIHLNSASSDKVVVEGNLGIGTTSPAVKLEVKTTTSDTTSVEGLRLYNAGGGIGAGVKIGLGVGASYSEKAYLRTDIVSGGSGRLFIGVNGSDRVLIDNAGNVGIGTTSPSTKLHVLSGVLNSSVATFSGANLDRGLKISTFNSGNNDGGVILDAQVALGVLTFATVGSERMRITSSGNVGIGTTSPAQKLDVIGGGIHTDGVIHIESGAPTLILQDSTDDDDHYIQFLNNAGSVYYQIDTTGDTWNFNSLAARSIKFGTAGSDRIVITGAGNVLIGTTTDSGDKLRVNGTARFTGNLYSTSTDVDAIKTRFLSGAANNSTSNGNLYLQYGKSNSVSIGETSTGGLNVAGNVGIGTTSPTSHLDLVGNARIGIDSEHAFQVTDDSANNFLTLSSTQRTTASAARDIKFRSYGTDATDNVLVMDMSSGNVGIGTASPLSKLEVSGFSTNTSTIKAGSLELQSYAINNGWLAENLYYNGSASGWTLRAAGSGTQMYMQDGAIEFRRAATGAAGSVASITSTMKMLKNGNVLIGTTTDSGYKLDVNGTARISGDLKLTGQATGYETSFNAGSIYSAASTFNGESAMFGALVLQSRGDAGRPILLVTGATPTERMRITSAGNVGIGTTSPSEKLHVTGTILSDQDEARIRFNSTSGTGRAYDMIGGNDGKFYFYDRTATSFRYVIDSSGNVGIGTTSPDALLTVSNTVDNGAAVRVQRTNALSGSYTELGTVGGSGRIESFNGNLTVGADASNTDSSSVIQFKVDNSEKARITSDGNLGIGTTSPALSPTSYTGGLHVENNSYIQARLSSTSSGAGLEFIPSSGDHWEIQAQTGSSLIFYNRTDSSYRMVLDGSGNVGIGTTNPGTKLDVNGSIRLSNSGKVEGRTFPYTTNIGSGADATTTFLNAGSTSGYLSRIALAGGSATDPNTIKFLTSSSERMRITAGGNVGIGTTLPSVQLDIEDSSNVIIDLNTTTANANTTIRFQEAGTVKATMGYEGASDVVLIANGGFTAGNGINIDSSNNVGIGTASPGEKLHVSGRTRVDQNSQALDLVGTDHVYSAWYPRGTSNGRKAYMGYASASATDFTVMNEDSGAFVIGTNGSERMRITSTGNVGIGTASPDYPLTVYNASGAVLKLDSGGANNSQVRFHEAGTLKGAITYLPASDQIRIYNTGDIVTIGTNNVGIGTTSPTQKLDVNGTARAVKSKIDFTPTSDTIALDIRGTGTPNDYFTLSNATGGANDVFLPIFFYKAATYGYNGGTNRYPSGVYGGGFIAAVDDTSYPSATGAGAAMHFNARTYANNGPLTNRYLFSWGSWLTTHMAMTAGGNLLIGTTTDSGEKLQVNGDADISGDINADGDFYQNGTQGYTGNVTIQQPSPNPPITLEINGGIITNVT